MEKNTKPEKILIALYDLSQGTVRSCKYEDIVVKVFELFPNDFALRGYLQYPDSSDVHKPLYGTLKRHGLVRAANKSFYLTEKGLSIAEKVSGNVRASIQQDIAKERLTRDMESEIARIKKSAAFGLFVEGKQEQILDTDYYSYLSVSVRTKRNDFLGRLRAVEEAIQTAVRIDSNPINTKLQEVHKYLSEKFRMQINKKLEA